MPQNKKRKPYLYIHHVFYDGILDEHRTTYHYIWEDYQWNPSKPDG